MNATLLIDGESLGEVFSRAGSVIQDQLIEEMKRILGEQGYHVVPKTGEWETPKEISARLGINPGSFCRLMGRGNVPVPRDIVRGPTGRTVMLQSTPALDAFIIKHKRP